MRGHCERARQWASLELDGELSTFEHAVLEAHVDDCPSCREFRAEISSLTGVLRAAPQEPFEGVVIARIRWRSRLRLAPAAAAMAVAAVGLGSILASSSLQNGSGGRLAAVQSLDITPEAASAAVAPDTMNLATSTALVSLRERPGGRPAGTNGSLQGGPVVAQR